ncbi:hypothetical protein J6590_016968 [Homalodisca vitripennis]|nr:hypothetical protein J6590_016968 [Homalodisca vitripennis]
MVESFKYLVMFLASNKLTRILKVHHQGLRFTLAFKPQNNRDKDTNKGTEQKQNWARLGGGYTKPSTSLLSVFGEARRRD